MDDPVTAHDQDPVPFNPVGRSYVGLNVMLHGRPLPDMGPVLEELMDWLFQRIKGDFESDVTIEVLESAGPVDHSGAGDDD